MKLRRQQVNIGSESFEHSINVALTSVCVNSVFLVAQEASAALVSAVLLLLPWPPQVPLSTALLSTAKM